MALPLVTILKTNINYVDCVSHCMDLKQASRQWDHKSAGLMNIVGYTQSHEHDHSLFVQSNSNHIIITVVYVDDIVIPWSNEEMLAYLKRFLHSQL